jgi:hypothetical protein
MTKISLYVKETFVNGLGTWIVKSKRHVVAAGDLGPTETAGPMTPSERTARPPAGA